MNHSIKFAVALLTSLPLVGCATAPPTDQVAKSPRAP